MFLFVKVCEVMPIVKSPFISTLFCVLLLFGRGIWRSVIGRPAACVTAWLYAIPSQSGEYNAVIRNCTVGLHT